MLSEERWAKLRAWAKAPARGPLPSRLVSREEWLAKEMAGQAEPDGALAVRREKEADGENVHD